MDTPDHIDDLLSQASSEQRSPGERLLALVILQVRIEGWIAELAKLAREKGQKWADPDKLLHIHRQAEDRRRGGKEAPFYSADLEEESPTLRVATDSQMEKFGPIAEKVKKNKSA
jgi:hypothetical protein